MIDLRLEYSILKKELNNTLEELLTILLFVILNTQLRTTKGSFYTELQEVVVKKVYYVEEYQLIVVKKLNLNLEMLKEI